MSEIVIIGAGLTGLSAAYHLEQAGFTDITIYEKESRPGGLMRSHVVNGFTFDYTGHFLHVNNPSFQNFITTIVGSLHAFDTISRKSAIYMHQTHTPFPIQMHLYGLPTDVIYECIEGFINRPKKKQSLTSFYDWTIFYFGKGFVKHFFEPYNSRLLSWPIKKLHAGWTGRFVPQTTLEHVIKGALAPAQQHEIGYNNTFFYPHQGGIEFFIQALCKQVKTPIMTQKHVVAINQQQKRITFSDGSTTTYRHLITTAPLDTTLSSMQHSTASSLIQAQSELWCSSLININLGFTGESFHPHHWVYFPQKEYAFYRLGQWNTISPQLAPRNHSSVYLELSFQPKKTPRHRMQKQIDVAQQQALTYLKKTPQDIATQCILEIPHAYVTYTPWREKHLSHIIKALEDLDIYSIGRFGAWKYSSMQEAYEDGLHGAEKIIHHHINNHQSTYTHTSWPVNDKKPCP